MHDLKNVLRDAYNRQSLCILFIDLQEQSFWSHSKPVYANAKKLSEHFRMLSIRPIWIAYDDELGIKTIRLYNYKNRLKDGKQFQVVNPQRGEAVFRKPEMDVFYDSFGENPLKLYIEKRGYDTFVFSGLYGDACIQESMEGLLDWKKDANIIAARDAIYNFRACAPFGWGADYMRYRTYFETLTDNYYQADTKQIINCLNF